MNAIESPPASGCTCLNVYDHCGHCRAVKAKAAAEAARRKAEAVKPPAPPVPPPVPPPSQPPLAERLLTAREAAAVLSIGVRTLWRLVEQQRMPQPVRFTRKLVRFSGAKLVQWMKEQADGAQQAR